MKRGSRTLGQKALESGSPVWSRSSRACARFESGGSPVVRARDGRMIKRERTRRSEFRGIDVKKPPPAA